MKTSELLIQAKALISDEKSWIQGTFAKNAYGEEISTYSEAAVCFCSLGALNRINDDISAYDPPENALRFLESAIPEPQTGVAIFNDSHTHTEVMEVWDKAIASAIEQGE